MEWTVDKVDECGEVAKSSEEREKLVDLASEGIQSSVIRV
jgi:hypothetical protein